MIQVTGMNDLHPDSRKTILAIDSQPQQAIWWLPRHQAKLREKATMDKVDLLFLGDSIIQAWEQEGKATWETYYQPRNALNLGFNGDRTEHLLWRLEQGEIEGISPKLVVLLIGTNNTGHRMDKPQETAQGIKAILTMLEKKLPHTKVLLLAIFPRSARPTQKLRILNQQVNDLIKDYADDQRIFFVDLNHHFLDQNGHLTSNVMDDFLHPNAHQYKVWAQAMEPYIERLMS
ncbi:lipolytic protein G-D-S-L family [Marinomonas posidonica IVIA-Po-181]|uniref:Lipolytic protein G-D-S-L family n=1 Tax=Marinomonas posidonica (strain CECT 7376 / NCIMB 14433 / IVIA-Po-181) TaxID=491952 RepID=F6D1E7_MARPP|nr:lipolytic protein G-D-S-L family [Marinomonas posidonica IVIA-Po-181]